MFSEDDYGRKVVLCKEGVAILKIGKEKEIMKMETKMKMKKKGFYVKQAYKIYSQKWIKTITKTE